MPLRGTERCEPLLPGAGGRRRGLGPWGPAVVLGFALLGPLAAAMSAPRRSRVRNGGFEQFSRYWSLAGARAGIVARASGGHCLRIEGRGSAAQAVIGLPPGSRWTAAVDYRTRGVKPRRPGSGFAFAAVYQLGVHGELVKFKDFLHAVGTRPWQRVHWTFVVAAQARTVSLRCGLYQASGVAWFDNWTLAPGNEPAAFQAGAEPLPGSPVPGGCVAIFREPDFPGAGGPGVPEKLAQWIRPAAGKVRFLRASDLADPAVLRPDRFDLVVLPYGDAFPAAARENFIRYLRDGGEFLSFGGYAFSRLLVQANGTWTVQEKVLAERRRRAMAPGRALPANGGFERVIPRNKPDTGVPDGIWRASDPARARIVSEAPFAGRRCAAASIPAGRDGGEAAWFVRLPCKAGHRYCLQAAMRRRDVRGPGYAFVSLYQYDGKGKLLTFHDFGTADGTGPWTVYRYEFTPAPGTAALVIRCGLYHASGTAWFDDVRLGDITGLRAVPMNTRTGAPRDGLGTRPEQIGVFDADFRLRRASAVRGAAAQDFFPGEVGLGAVSGWAASGVQGQDDARWIPLLDSFDRYGRPRGAAAALMLHYNGFYSGSEWAFFGIEHPDVFRAAGRGFRTGLQRLVRFMIRRVHLLRAGSEQACWFPGERPGLFAEAVNDGRRPARGRLEIRLVDPSGRLEFRAAQAVSLAAGERRTLHFRGPALGRVRGLHRIRVELRLESGLRDRLSRGFMAAVPGKFPAHSPLRFSQNDLGFGRRPLFLFGSDAYANVYQSNYEGPPAWNREHRACRDFGFEIYENLQYSPADHRLTERDWRRFIGMAESTQEYGLVFMPGLLVGHNVAVGDAEVAAEDRECAEYAERLGSAPRLLWYINGDYKLQFAASTALAEKWRRFIHARYPAPPALRRAWGGRAVERNGGWRSLRFPPVTGTRWDDPVAVDRARFKLSLTREWNRRHVAAIRRRDPRHPITSEYYSSPFNGIDLRLTLDGQDLANFGFFDRPGRDLSLLPLRLAWNDLRGYGKSVGVGEYGVKTHPAWTVENGGRGYHIARTPAQRRQLFIDVALEAFGRGASRVQNWCLRDAAQWVFPWGVFYPGPLVPKDAAYVHRNLSLALRLFSPRYSPPGLGVLLCSNLRVGNRASLGVRAGLRAFETLLGLHCPDFLVLDDTRGPFPAGLRALLYPAAFCPGDAEFARVTAWVRAGGRLLVTGDFGWDAQRRPARVSRFQALLGVGAGPPRYGPDERFRQSEAATVSARAAAPALGPAAPQAAVTVPAGSAAVLVRTARESLPVLLEHRLGKGLVWACTDPVELAEDSGPARRLYRAFLERAGLGGDVVRVRPDTPDVFLLRRTTRTGVVFVPVDRRETGGRRRLTFQTPAGALGLTLRPGYAGLAAFGPGGRLLGVVSDGPARIHGREVLDSRGLTGVFALDGRDLGRCHAALVLPFFAGTAGAIRCPALAGRGGSLVWGDVQNGRFRVFEEAAGPGAGAQRELVLDPDRSTLIGLWCIASERAHWCGEITHLVSAPEKRPGY